MEGLISSSLSLAKDFLREVACFDFEAFAEKRSIKAFSSLALSSVFFVAILHLFAQELAGLVPESVIPRIKRNLIKINVSHVGTDFV